MEPQINADKKKSNHDPFEPPSSPRETNQNQDKLEARQLLAAGTKKRPGVSRPFKFDFLGVLGALAAIF